MSWIQAMEQEKWDHKSQAVIRVRKRQIALLRSGDRTYALDNRCPHEGYPLSEGTIQTQSCVLTCNWHNWKFDLNTGENVKGDDNVSVYEVKMEDGFVWIRIPEVTREEQSARILNQLQQAFQDQSYDRAARELARLHFHHIDPVIAVRKAVEWSHDRLEDGMDHSYAVTADWLTLASEVSLPEQRLICLLESIDYMSESSLRQPLHPYADRPIPYSESGFLDAVESEDEETAVSMIRSAVSAGMHFSDLERALATAALRHYNDFGHSLIYVTKAGALIRHLGPEVEPYVLPALVRSLVLSFREDLLPEFRNFGRVLDEWPQHMGATGASAAAELEGKSADFAMRWTAAQSQNASAEQLYETLLQAGAENLLRYDLAYQFSFDRPVTNNIGWLDFTHAITFGNAVAKVCRKHPELWKYGLLQMACFAGRNHRYLDPSVNPQDWIVQDQDSFYQDCLRLLLDHGRSAPIFVAHLVKTFVAVREEASVAGHECRAVLLAALNRFLHSPLKEKHVYRTVLQAMDLVGRDFE